MFDELKGELDNKGSEKGGSDEGELNEDRLKEKGIEEGRLFERFTLEPDRLDGGRLITGEGISDNSGIPKLSWKSKSWLNSLMANFSVTLAVLIAWLSPLGSSLSGFFDGEGSELISEWFVEFVGEIVGEIVEFDFSLLNPGPLRVATLTLCFDKFSCNGVVWGVGLGLEFCSGSDVFEGDGRLSKRFLWIALVLIVRSVVKATWLLKTASMTFLDL